MPITQLIHKKIHEPIQDTSIHVNQRNWTWCSTNLPLTRISVADLTVGRYSLELLCWPFISFVEIGGSSPPPLNHWLAAVRVWPTLICVVGPPTSGLLSRISGIVVLRHHADSSWLLPLRFWRKLGLPPYGSDVFCWHWECFFSFTIL